MAWHRPRHEGHTEVLTEACMEGKCRRREASHVVEKEIGRTQRIAIA